MTAATSLAPLATEVKPETLTFVTKKERQKAYFDLWNRGEGNQIYKVKTTNNKDFKISPVHFSLEPNDRRRVEVIFLGKNMTLQKERISVVFAHYANPKFNVEKSWEAHKLQPSLPGMEAREVVEIKFKAEDKPSDGKDSNTSGQKSIMAKSATIMIPVAMPDGQAVVPVPAAAAGYAKDQDSYFALPATGAPHIGRAATVPAAPAAAAAAPHKKTSGEKTGTEGAEQPPAPRPKAKKKAKPKPVPEEEEEEEEAPPPPPPKKPRSRRKVKAAPPPPDDEEEQTPVTPPRPKRKKSPAPPVKEEEEEAATPPPIPRRAAAAAAAAAPAPIKTKKLAPPPQLPEEEEEEEAPPPPPPPKPVPKPRSRRKVKAPPPPPVEEREEEEPPKEVKRKASPAPKAKQPAKPRSRTKKTNAGQYDPIADATKIVYVYQTKDEADEEVEEEEVKKPRKISKKPSKKKKKPVAVAPEEEEEEQP